MNTIIPAVISGAVVSSPESSNNNYTRLGRRPPKGAAIRISTLLYALVILLTSCGKSGHVKFDPQEPRSTMTIAEREAAIAAQLASTAEVDTAVLVGHGVKLTIMTPKPDAERCVTDQMSRELAMKMLSIASQDGVAGIGGDPDFVLAVDITSCDKKLTGTAPQMTMLTYGMTLYVGNAATGDVYGSTATQISGTGKNERQAALAAARGLKGSTEIRQVLSLASARIITYYARNAAAIKAKAEAQIARGDYERAYLLLRSVPQQAGGLFKYAQKRLPAVGAKLYQDDARIRQLTAQLESASATSSANAAEIQKLRGQLAMKQLDKAAQCEQKMTSAEMRKQIALEDAAKSPFKMILCKLAYGLGNFIPMPK